MCLATLFSFLGSRSLVRLLGEELIAALTKVMGMILGAIGVQMPVEGGRALVAGPG